MEKKTSKIEFSELLCADDIEELSPRQYQYFKGLKERRIIFNDEVDDNIIESVIIPLLSFDKDGTGEPIELIFTTSGGEIYSGMALCDIIDRLQTPTTITILSNAFSMGSLLAMAGYNNPKVKTVCYPYTVFLIHDGSFYLEGSAGQVRETFIFNEKYEGMIDEYILSHSKIPSKLLEEKRNHEWYLTAQEALQYGIVNEVL